MNRTALTPLFRSLGSEDCSDADSTLPDWKARWIFALLALGVTVRLGRYLLRFPMWGDETLLAANLLDRDFAGLLRPLDHLQVAPYLFMAIEHAATKLFGFSEWSLRLLPLTCSLGSLFLFYRLARLVFRGEAVVVAVGIFAVSYAGIRYSSEVKPYGVDLFASTALLTLAAAWWRRQDQLRWLCGLAALTALAVALSFPAVFVAGGISLTLAVLLWSGKSRLGTAPVFAGQSGYTPADCGRAKMGPAPLTRRAWLPWLVFNVLLVATFAAIYVLTIKAQEHASLGGMRDCWDHAFPPLTSPGRLAYWMLYAHSGPIFAQPVGGDNFGSLGTTLLCIVAVAALWRGRHFGFLLLCASPFALNLAAAALRRFPYGGHMRMAMHLMPLVCLLAGFGAATLLRRITTRSVSEEIVTRSVSEAIVTRSVSEAIVTRSVSEAGCMFPRLRFGLRWNALRVPRPASVAVVGLMALGIACFARDCWLPCKDVQNLWMRDFSRWFWSNMSRDCELVCIETDLGEKFPTSPFYLCYQRIYSPRHARGEPAHLERVSPTRPLACVQYWSHFQPYDPAAFARWLEKMKRDYDLVSCQLYPVRCDADGDAVPEASDRIEVYQFLPKVRNAANRDVPTAARR